MRPAPKAAHGFSLVEVLVGLVVIVVISAASWYAVSVLSPASIATENRIKAEHLITKSQEELRQRARDDYGLLNSCTYAVNNPCQLPTNISNEFYGFTRTLTCASVPGAVEMKKCVISVSWQEDGQTRQRQSVIALTQPPDPPGGNIFGVVKRTGKDEILAGVLITITEINNGQLRTATSKATGYDFAQGSGEFPVGAGTWRLTATRAGYEDYTHPQLIVVNSGESSEVNFEMVKKPEPARVHVQYLDGPSGTPLGIGPLEIFLYEDGERLYPKVEEKTIDNFDYVVDITDDQQHCYTVATQNLYAARLVGKFQSPCDPNLPYDWRGWSSAVDRGNNTFNTANCSAWAGGADQDRLCVSQGDEVSVTIPLWPLPTTRLYGKVTDSEGNPIEKAQIRASWFGSFFDLLPVSDAQGNYNVEIFARHSVFPDGQPYSEHRSSYQAKAILDNVETCCKVPRQIIAESPQEYLGPMKEGQDVPHNFVIDTSYLKNCGDLDGNVFNALDGTPITGARVTIYQENPFVDGVTNAGLFQFMCLTPSDGFRLREGDWGYVVQKDGFYELPYNGNAQYLPRSPFHIAKDIKNPSDPIYLWPKGMGGTVTLQVFKEGTSDALANMQGVLKFYGGDEQAFTTTADGTVVFPAGTIRETWPPPDSVLSGAQHPEVLQLIYPREHTITVRETDGYKERTLTFKLNANESKTIPIAVTPKPQDGGI